MDTLRTEHSALVAEHYNKLEETGLEHRAQSRIFYMRNFNNWIKSILIGQYIQLTKDTFGESSSLSVLDMCCGKGGDLLKWKKAGVSHIVFSDIASTSVQQCESRFGDMKKRDQQHQRRGTPSQFTAEFIPADITKVRLCERYEKETQSFELTSCQFSLHYSFETLPQADRFMQNAAERLKVGGHFIGTIPDSNELVKRWRKSKDGEFGNSVYKIKFLSEDKQNLPLFGCKYDFHLEGVVDCPEFLVYFPALEKLAAKYGLRCVLRKTFADFFNDNWTDDKNRGLLGRMQSLEPFPADENVKLVGEDTSQYVAAQQKWDEVQSTDSRRRVGTLSLDEWEAITIYMVFAFEKVCDGPLPNSSDAKGSSSTES